MSDFSAGVFTLDAFEQFSFVSHDYMSFGNDDRFVLLNS